MLCYTYLGNYSFNRFHCLYNIHTHTYVRWRTLRLYTHNCACMLIASFLHDSTSGSVCRNWTLVVIGWLIYNNKTTNQDIMMHDLILRLPGCSVYVYSLLRGVGFFFVVVVHFESKIHHDEARVMYAKQHNYVTLNFVTFNEINIKRILTHSINKIVYLGVHRTRRTLLLLCYTYSSW